MYNFSAYECQRTENFPAGLHSVCGGRVFLRHCPADTPRKDDMNLTSRNFISMNLMAAALILALAASGALLPVASTKAEVIAIQANAPAFSSSLAAASDSPDGVRGSGGLPCAACGVIESIRELEAAVQAGVPESARREITIRMKDGSMHVFTDGNSASWKYGERISIIAGAL
jgi:hypothetical protein